jgi:hypothetical protein
LFGLDAHFKAYSFVLKYASKKLELLSEGMTFIKSGTKQLLKRIREGKLLQSRKRAETNSIYFVVEATWIESELNEGNSVVMATLNSVRDKVHSKGRVGSSIAADMPIPWIMTNEPWSVKSYELVWGPGHAYGGASIITDAVGSLGVLDSILSR